LTEAILIKNGYVIRPEKKTILKEDVAVVDGVIIDCKMAREMHIKNMKEIDASGCYVAPGFIDMHVHVFKDFTELGIDGDLVGIKQGVTTIVDAGSSGIYDYKSFKDLMISRSETEILSFLNISKLGLCGGRSELANLDELMEVEELKEFLAKEKTVVGLKARMSGSVLKGNGIFPLEHARKLADAADLPIMVHIGNGPPSLPEILALLREGDIVTHAFHGKKGGILNEVDELIQEATDALKRGAVFDVGHGTESFSFLTMEKFKKNFRCPFTISTDIYLQNYNTPVGSLMTTMSKLLALGFALEEVVECVTLRPAQTLGLKEQGTLENGTRADITLFEIDEQEKILFDAAKREINSKRHLKPYMTIREGKVVYKT